MYKDLCSKGLLFLTGDGNVNGFGLEFYIEAPGSEIAETIHDVKKSWQFQLLYTVSQLAAGAAYHTQALNQFQLILGLSSGSRAFQVSEILLACSTAMIQPPKSPGHCASHAN